MKRTQVLAIVIAAAAVATGARAGNRIVSDGVLEVRCADRGKARVPATASLSHWITNRAFTSSDRNVVALVYESTHSSGGSGGVIEGSLNLETADGSVRSIGAVEIEVGATATRAAGLVELEESLAKGSTLIWDVEFRRFRPLTRETCIQLLSVVERGDQGVEP